MTKRLISIITFLICLQQTFAQKASDILENAKPITKGHKLFLRYDINDKVLKVDAAKKDQEVDFTTVEDSIIFLVRKNAINIYLRPLNPLNYSFYSELNVVTDPINKAAEEALGSVIEALVPISNQFEKKSTNSFNQIASFTNEDDPKSKKCNFDKIKIEIEELKTMLLDSKKEDITRVFKGLKAMSFVEEKSTIEALHSIDEGIEDIESHFDDVEEKISETQGMVNLYKCSDSFIVKHIFTSILKELLLEFKEQKKRLIILNTSYKLVKDMQIKASMGGSTDELKWCIPLNEVASKEGKISIYNILVKESGYKLSDDKEIVSSEPKELVNRSIRIRKFQRFVPEVSVGTAFTFLKYNSYGTTSDSSGQQFVGTPTENIMKNLNITTMLNLNYYISHSLLHPFYQIGVGVNSGIPTILTGVGVRSNISGIKRMAVAGGIAMTWVKELQNLKVGDKVSGTDDIEKDYNYGSAPMITPYISLQYNF
jgi:hypothetical protein